MSENDKTGKRYRGVNLDIFSIDDPDGKSVDFLFVSQFGKIHLSFVIVCYCLPILHFLVGVLIVFFHFLWLNLDILVL